MAQKKTTKAGSKTKASKPTVRRSSSVASRTKTTKKPAAKRSVAGKSATKKSTATRSTVEKVDYYPNRVALLTATAAVLILLVLGLITGL